MRLMMMVILFLCSACASRPDLKPRTEPSPTTISVDVIKDALLAGKIDQRTEALLRQALLANNVGVPVTESATGDLTLKVTITRANFTNATAYDWALVENAGGRVIAQGSKTTGWGHTEQQITDTVLADLVAIDTRQYATNSKTNLPPKPDVFVNAYPDSATDGSNAWAVVIGVANYRDELADAPYADQDAVAFAQFAKTTLGVPEKQIKVLTNDRASRADITAALFEWLPRNAVSGGPVYVFFSGHGSPNVVDGATYLVPYDADPTYIKSGGIPVAKIQSELSKLKSDRVYLILDACFTGGGDRSVLAKGTRPLVPIQETATDSVIVLSASKASQTTGVKEDATRGLFTYYLIAGLVGAADANADKNVTLEELIAYTSVGVEKEARLSNRDQQPSAQLPASIDASKTVIVSGLN